jgi:hypothetical protein
MTFYNLRRKLSSFTSLFHYGWTNRWPPRTQIFHVVHSLAHEILNYLSHITTSQKVPFSTQNFYRTLHITWGYLIGGGPKQKIVHVQMFSFTEVKISYCEFKKYFIKKKNSRNIVPPKGALFLLRFYPSRLEGDTFVGAGYQLYNAWTVHTNTTHLHLLYCLLHGLMHVLCSPIYMSSVLLRAASELKRDGSD